ncbi:MAG: hypothetical protein IT353_20905, partial [Gemmatimonadaceae bacterium]|nr:hypothetical protein [Gemmatimonadaceae bacterium]
MPTALLATADDLIAWAPRREAQEMLPALVRRLVHATAPRATHVGFPAGNAIHAPGWDGVVVLNDDHHVIPRGLSVWEMGTNRDPRTKAQSDYAKRMSAPGTGPRGIVDPAASTFVFVTPRRWSGKSDWIAERKADAVWRDVRAYDADDLEEWLEQAPATHVWASHLVGVRPDDVDDVDAIWRDWSGSTEPALSTELMLAGRANAQQEVGKWLRGAGAPFLGVAAESIEASLAFVGATLEAMPPDDRVALLSRMIVVRSATAWHQLMGAHHPLVLLPTFPAGDLLVRAERHGHRVLMPLAMDDAREADLRVPRLRRDAARAALEAMGLTSERAGSLDGVARRSLLALRRALSRIPAVRRPPWSSGNEAVGLVAITLLGAGKVDDAADCAALAYIADESSTVAVARLRRWVVSADPPVRSVGDAFFLVSKAEAWETVRPHVTAENMRRFEALARRIFGIAPALAPDTEIVGLDGKVSALMLRGTADTLALLGARGAGIVLADGETAEGVATRIVQAALVAEDWSAFAGQLPALAEAAPDALLDAVDASLAREEANAAQAGGEPLAPPRELASLLWALETVAWSSGHLTRVVRALGRLAALIGDTGAGNHPRGSLRTILLPWLPSTSASAEDRLHAIDQVLVVTPGVGWQLLLDLLPQSGSWVMRGSRPTWREWGQEQTTNVSAVAYEQQITAIVDRVLVNASGVPERWAAVIEKLDEVPVQSHQAIVAELTRLASVEDATPDFIAVRTAIWHALRMLVSRHRSFADADWALPTAYVAPLAALWPAFAPSEVVERSAWL